MILPEGNTVTVGTTYAALVNVPKMFVGAIWAGITSTVDVKFPSTGVVTLDGSKGEYINFLQPVDLNQLQVQGTGGAADQVLKYGGTINPPSAQLPNNI